MNVQTETRRVFLLVRNARFNTRGAEEYGRRAYVFANVRECPTFDTDALSVRVLEVLAGDGFDPKEDYIALTGPAQELAVFVATVLAAYGEVRVLLFDARNGRYRARTLIERGRRR